MLESAHFLPLELLVESASWPSHNRVVLGVGVAKSREAGVKVTKISEIGDGVGVGVASKAIHLCSPANKKYECFVIINKF